MQKRVYYRETISLQVSNYWLNHDFFRLLNYKIGLIFKLHIREGGKKVLSSI